MTETETNRQPDAPRERGGRLWTWTKRGLVGLVVFVLLAGVIYQFVATKIDAYRWPASGEMVDVGGYSMHLYCTGEEARAPTVVMDVGAGGNLLDWQPVQPGSPNSRGCAPTTAAAPVGATQVPNRARASSYVRRIGSGPAVAIFTP